MGKERLIGVGVISMLMFAFGAAVVYRIADEHGGDPAAARAAIAALRSPREAPPLPTTVLTASAELEPPPAREPGARPRDAGEELDYAASPALFSPMDLAALAEPTPSVDVSLEQPNFQAAEAAVTTATAFEDSPPPESSPPADAATDEQTPPFAEQWSRQNDADAGGDNPLRAEARLGRQEGIRESVEAPPTPDEVVPPTTDEPADELALPRAVEQRRDAVRSYRVREGDTLSEIARNELGDASRWIELYQLNRERHGEKLRQLKPGVELVLPSALRPHDWTAREPAAAVRR